MREADAFLQTLASVPPDAVTACRGWTAHELIAHLASGADALADQVEAHLQGRPVPEFGAWQVREPPYRAMDDGALRRRLEAAEARMTTAFRAALTIDPDLTVPAVGWGLPIVELDTHLRQEFAIHRWDLTGDDEIGVELLGRPALLSHSVRLLSDSLLRVGLERDPEPGEPLTVRLRCAGAPDLLLAVRDGVGALSLETPADCADVVESDPAARLLLLWGRRPADSRRVRSNLSPQRLARVQTILAGY